MDIKYEDDDANPDPVDGISDVKITSTGGKLKCLITSLAISFLISSGSKQLSILE
jgi:hypothetical protein